MVSLEKVGPPKPPKAVRHEITPVVISPKTNGHLHLHHTSLACAQPLPGVTLQLTVHTLVPGCDALDLDWSHKPTLLFPAHFVLNRVHQVLFGWAPKK